MEKKRQSCLIWILLLAGPVCAQQRLSDPYGTYECARDVIRQETTHTIKSFIANSLSGGTLPPLKGCVLGLISRRNQDAGKGDWALFLAELMKAVGDYRAPTEYNAAIDADQYEAAFTYFYGEYLRNFRAPNEPLFPGAEKQYIRCGQILDEVKSKNLEVARDEETRSRLGRSLVALHQRDGVPLKMRDGGVPVVSFASIFRAAETNADLDRTSDVRDYTAAAAFAQSSIRKKAPLTRDEYRSLIRVETPIESFNRLRFRDGNMPVIDVFY